MSIGIIFIGRGEVTAILQAHGCYPLTKTRLNASPPGDSARTTLELALAAAGGGDGYRLRDRNLAAMGYVQGGPGATFQLHQQLPARTTAEPGLAKTALEPGSTRNDLAEHGARRDRGRG